MDILGFFLNKYKDIWLQIIRPTKYKYNENSLGLII